MLKVIQVRFVVQIEIGQLDTTIGVQEVPFGNLTYWFDSSSLYMSITLTQGMMNKPIGVFVSKTTPPIGPPPRLDNQVKSVCASSFGDLKCRNLLTVPPGKCATGVTLVSLLCIPLVIPTR